MRSEIAQEILERAIAPITFVAIDGVDGAGKTTFADELAPCFDSTAVIRASVDSFHHPRAIRYRQGKDSPSGFFEDSYDYDVLRRILLDPLKSTPAKPYCSAWFDHHTDKKVKPVWKQPPTRAILIFDGIFLHRPELVQYWDYSIFLEVSTEESIRRCNEREGLTEASTDPDGPRHRRYVQGQKIYLQSCQPKSVCTRVVDNGVRRAEFGLRTPYSVARSSDSELRTS